MEPDRISPVIQVLRDSAIFFQEDIDFKWSWYSVAQRTKLSLGSDTPSGQSKQ